MIKAESLEFKYDLEKEDKAVDSLDISIKDGEFVAIIGHNGSGKSTFAKLCNCIYLPSGGTLYVSDIDTKEEESIWEIRKTAGLVFQNPDNQIVATIVEEDVAFGPENLSVKSEDIIKRVDESLDIVGMLEYKKKQTHALSGGQKQRIAISGILAMKPRCIILDEPTAMLDPSGRKEVMEVVTKLNKEEGITIVHITHFMEETINCDRVIVMEKGKKIIEGTPHKIFSQVEKLKEISLDVPQVTLLAHELIKQNVNISREIISIDEMVDELCRLL